MTPETIRKDETVGHKIRTTFTPGVVLTVDDAELLDLTRQGLVLDDEAVAKIEKAEAAEAAKADKAAASAEADDKKKG